MLPDIERVKIVKSPVQKSELDLLYRSEEEVIAIGGGAVIDTAKIICKRPIVCYPTTAAGSSNTSHSVYWDGTDKFSISTPKPEKVIIKEEYINSIPENIFINTKADAISHCYDSLISIFANNYSRDRAMFALSLLEKSDLKSTILAGCEAGEAINITSTNVLHALFLIVTGKHSND